MSKSGPDALNWKGGRRIRDDGCVELRIDGESILEHRYAMGLALGRKLRSDEIVHHDDEIRHHNQIENLVLTTRSKHALIHAKERDEITGRFI